MNQNQTGAEHPARPDRQTVHIALHQLLDMLAERVAHQLLEDAADTHRPMTQSKAQLEAGEST